MPGCLAKPHRRIQIHRKRKDMKTCFYTVVIAAALVICVLLVRQSVHGQDANLQSAGQMGGMIPANVAPQTNGIAEISVGVIEIPAGYRDWRLISVAHEAGNLNDIRAVLGNDIAIRAFREGTLPFPDGTIIARLAWDYVPSDENNSIFGHPQSFVAGSPKNGVQFMVKDSKKYADTGGWGYAQFNDGKSVPPSMLSSCFPCHEHIQSRDDVFTNYSP